MSSGISPARRISRDRAPFRRKRLLLRAPRSMRDCAHEIGFVFFDLAAQDVDALLVLLKHAPHDLHARAASCARFPLRAIVLTPASSARMRRFVSRRWLRLVSVTPSHSMSGPSVSLGR